jgi:hypothetical protein
MTMLPVSLHFHYNFLPSKQRTSPISDIVKMRNTRTVLILIIQVCRYVLQLVSRWVTNVKKCIDWVGDADDLWW